MTEKGLVDMTAAQDQGVYEVDPRAPQSPGRTGFRQWCEEVLKPAVLT